MEESVKVEKRRKKLPLILIALSVVIILCTVFGVLGVTGYLPVPTSEGITTLEMAALRKKAGNVQDENTLRELLLLDEKLDIVVTKDIEISDTFLVNGTKTLYGDATIKMNICGLFTEKGAFQIQGGSSLTIDGLTIDGTGMADGIVVNQRAKLIYKSGHMQYVRYGVRTNGEVTIEDVTIEHIATAGVFASFRSKVYVNGGSYSDAYTSLLRVDSGGYMEIADGVVARQCVGDIIYNEGTLRLYGGIYSDTINNAINNIGDLVTEYKGAQKDGYIRLNNIGRIGVRIDSNEDNEIADIYATNVGTNGVFVTNKETQGKTMIQNCVFDTTGTTSGNTFSLSSKVNVKDVTIKNSQKGSVYIRKGAKVTIEDLQIQNCKGTAMEIEGTLNGKKITIDGATGNGIAISAPEKSKREVNLSEVQTSNVVKNNFLLRAKATATVKDSVFGASERTSIYISNETVCTLENVEIQGATDKDVYAVSAREGSNTTLRGKSVIKGGPLGGVWLDKKTTFNMESGKIAGVNAPNDGGAVHLRPEATFNLKGGEITGNTSGKAGGGVYVAKNATFNMTGGTISKNKSVNSGGGVYVLGTMNFTGGTITGNKANTVGDGISNKGTVVVGGNAYMAKDEIALGSTSIVLKLKGNSLRRHSAKEPLLIEPEMNTTPGVIVAECDSEGASTKMLSCVASGSKAYTLQQTSNKMTVSINEADMDMTGADKAYVSNYKELKEAVETTDTKRFVILKSDIKVDAAIVVPTGTTVYICDDGTPRTISRSDGKGSNIFRTYYGTGLYLAGTSYGNLIFDGTTTPDKKAEDIDPLVRVRGTTEIRNVAFKNNNTSENGGFIRQNYGSTAVYSSTFTNGRAFSGGAVVAEQGKFYVKDSIFDGNTSQASGGAIRSTTSSSNPVDITVVSCEFKNNNAGSLAGAINNDGGTLKVTNSNFLNNIAGSGHGGAIGITNTVSAEISGSGIFKGNRSTTNGGAIYTNNSQLSVKGYTFEGNHAAMGGAMMVNSGNNKGTSAITVKECTFDGNEAANQGGAIYNGGRTVTVTDVTFGASAGNVSKGNGGAVYNAGRGTLNLIGTEKNKAVFSENVSTSGNGGAICVGTGELNIKGYDFRSNSAVNGGAINLNNDKINADISKSGFYSNAASGGGGAVYNNNSSNARYGITMTDCIFGAAGQGNTAVLSGGAIYTKAELNLTNTDFTENSGSVGGAVNACGGRELNVASCTFERNVSTRTTHEGGGALSITSGTRAIFDGTGIFEGNTAACAGGAIYTNSSTLQIPEYIFDGNSASTGGAIYINSDADNANTAILLNKTVFINNETTAVNTYMDGDTAKAGISNGAGGAVYNTSRKLTLNGNTFEGNQANGFGGAVYNSGSLKASEVEFKANVATVDGGAIGNYGKEPRMTDCRYIGNSARNGGAIYSGGGNTIYIENSGDSKIEALFEGNTASNYGGAIGMGTGHANVTGYSFKENTAVTGGAIHVNSANSITTVEASDFAANVATKSGGAIYLKGTAKITGATVLEGNSAANGGAIYNAGATVEVDNIPFGGTYAVNIATENGAAIYNESGSMKLIGGTEQAVVEGHKVSGNNHNGGAIYLAKGSLSVDGYTFKDNSAYNGGAIFIAGGDNASDKIVISNSKFVKNHADYRGGAMNINVRAVTVTDTIFGGAKDDGNDAKDRYGAIYIGGGANVTLNGTDAKKAVFSYNSAPWGGAYGMGSGTTTISGYAFKNNTATGRAGAFYIGGGTLNIVGNGAENEVFEENKAADGGALYLGNASTLNVTGYTFQKNSATNGGLLRTDGTEGQKASFTGSVIQENTASQKGGAIYNLGSLTTNLVTFSENKSEGFGGAIYNDKTAELTDTRFTGNGGEQGGAIAQENANAAITVKASGKNPDMAVFESNTTNWNGAAIRTSAGSVTLKGYQLKSHESKNNGGAIYVDGTTVLEVEGCTFTDNTALRNAKNGGAIAVWSVNARAKITSSVFERNTAANLGGAVAILNGKLEVIASTFRENEAPLGGAIGLNDNKAIQADLTECIFEKNTATNQGGAIYSGAKENDGQALTVTNCQFGGTLKDGTNLGNTATNQGGAIYMEGGAGLILNVKENASVPALMEGNCSTANEGGAVYRASNSVGGVDITGYTFTKNYAKTNGGAVCVRGNISVNVKNSVFGGDGTSADFYALGNKADGNGGAIYIGNEATLRIEGDSAAQSVFKGNTAKGYGGAVAVGTRNLYVNNTTFEYNKATGTGGAIRVNCSANTTVSVQNSSFKNNSSSGGGAISTAGRTYTYLGCTFERNTPNDTSRN